MSSYKRISLLIADGSVLCDWVPGRQLRARSTVDHRLTHTVRFRSNDGRIESIDGLTGPSDAGVLSVRV